MLGGRPSDQLDRTGRYKTAIATAIAILLFGPVVAAVPNTIEAVSWDHNASGHLIVNITCTEPVDTSAYRSYTITDPPRAVVVVYEITEPVKPGVLTINDPHVAQLRLGHHEYLSPPELHLILDLQSEAVQILELGSDGNRISIEVGVPQRPTATPTAVETPTEIHSPSPFIPTSTPPLVPPATATMTPTFRPPLTVTPSYPDLPAPAVMPTTPVQPRTPETTTPVATQTLVVAVPPTPVAELEMATHLVDIAANPRPDGSTLLRITANGRLPRGCARYLETTDEPPRIILSIRGISAPDLPRTLDIGDSNLNRIRLIQDAETAEGELHVVLHPSRDGVSVGELNQVGPHLVVQLVPAPQR